MMFFTPVHVFPHLPDGSWGHSLRVRNAQGHPDDSGGHALNVRKAEVTCRIKGVHEVPRTENISEIVQQTSEI